MSDRPTAEQKAASQASIERLKRQFEESRRRQQQDVTVRAGPTRTRTAMGGGSKTVTEETPQISLPASEVTRRSYEAFKQVVKEKQEAGGGTVTSADIERRRTANIAKEVAEKGGVEVVTTDEAARQRILAEGSRALKGQRPSSGQADMPILTPGRGLQGRRTFEGFTDEGKSTRTITRQGAIAFVRQESDPRQVVTRRVEAVQQPPEKPFEPSPFEQVKRGTVGLGAEFVASGARAVGAEKTAKEIEEAAGLREDKPVASPLSFFFAAGHLGLARLGARSLVDPTLTEADYERAFKAQLEGAQQRPIEFISATGVDAAITLLGLKGLGGAAKARGAPIKTAEAAPPPTDVTRAVVRAETKPPSGFRTETVNLGRGMAVQPKPPFKTERIELGSGTVKAPGDKSGVSTTTKRPPSDQPPKPPGSGEFEIKSGGQTLIVKLEKPVQKTVKKEITKQAEKEASKQATAQTTKNIQVELGKGTGQVVKITRKPTQPEKQKQQTFGITQIQKPQVKGEKKERGPEFARQRQIEKIEQGQTAILKVKQQQESKRMQGQQALVKARQRQQQKLEQSGRPGFTRRSDARVTARQTTITGQRVKERSITTPITGMRIINIPRPRPPFIVPTTRTITTPPPPPPTTPPPPPPTTRIPPPPFKLGGGFAFGTSRGRGGPTKVKTLPVYNIALPGLSIGTKNEKEVRKKLLEKLTGGPKGNFKFDLSFGKKKKGGIKLP